MSKPQKPNKQDLGKRRKRPARPVRDSPSAIRNQETILLAVTGKSPAILTETVWALAHEKPAVVPNRVVVLTTTDGRDALSQELFTPQPEFDGTCVWDTLRTALEKTGHDLSGRLRFGTTPDDIRVFTTPDARTGRSRELGDIRTVADNAAVADFILDEVRRIVENSDTRLIASIAGGRKTMGALLYACLTLIGRETDRLTHVLVSEPFEDGRLRPKFHFPAQPARQISGREGQRLDAAQARIDLANVPFVPLRNRFTDIADMPGSFTRTVARYSRELKDLAGRPAVIAISHMRKTVTVNGREIRTRSKILALLHYLLVRNEEQRVPTGQLEAVDDLNTWLAAQGASVWRGNFDAEAVKHELCELRTQLRRHDTGWSVPLRSLVLTRFKFTVTK